MDLLKEACITELRALLVEWTARQEEPRTNELYRMADRIYKLCDYLDAMDKPNFRF